MLWRCWLGGRKGIQPVKMGDGGGGHWLVRMKWCPAGWSVCLPLLIFPCTIKSRSSLLAPAHPGGHGKRAIKRLWRWCGMSPSTPLMIMSASTSTDSLRPQVMHRSKGLRTQLHVQLTKQQDTNFPKHISPCHKMKWQDYNAPKHNYLTRLLLAV